MASIAQDQTQEAPTSTEQPEQSDAEGDTAPPYPADLGEPGSDLDTFKLRLVPLNVDQLTALAARWQEIVQGQSQAVIDATIAARASGSEAGSAELDQIVALSDTRSDGFSHFSAVIDNLEKKGGDEATITSYRAYRNAVLLEEKQQADTKTLFKMAMNWLTSPDGGIELAWDVLVIIIAFVALILVARLIRGYARRLLGRIPDLSKLLQAFLAMVIYWVTVAIGLMVVLSALGVDISPIFALVGGASFIIAFAMQDTLGNLAAGLMIMFNRPFDQGDYITAGGTSGTVKSVSVVSTTVATPDNQIIVIPNSKVWGDVITNTTASTTRRIDLVFGIGYDDSIEDAQRVLEEVITAHPDVLSDPAPVIRVSELADSSVNFIARPWTKSEDYWTVLWDLTRAVKEAFDRNGISIPYPQADMHVKVPSAGLAIAQSGQLEAFTEDGYGTPEGARDYASGDDGESDS